MKFQWKYELSVLSEITCNLEAERHVEILSFTERKRKESNAIKNGEFDLRNSSSGSNTFEMN